MRLRADQREQRAGEDGADEFVSAAMRRFLMLQSGHGGPAFSLATHKFVDWT